MSGAPKKPAYEYLLNRVERAAQSDEPFAAGYAEARKDVLAYFAALTELAAAQGGILTAYRLGNGRRAPGAAIDRAYAAEEKLAELRAKVGAADPGVSS